ncbi:MAG: DNA-binding protein [Deltaproteobacteria bacterium]|nr:DNA-binding protein [Deltaproteobacteria bacterium]RLB31183.1 MAG: DNA-binding protein [Deltaproteobacteria bacterium]
MKRTGKTEKKLTHWINDPTCPRLLPLKKAAQYMGLTVWALRERIWNGQIPVVQFPGGRKQYIDILDIEQFIQQNKRVID